jgi:hypothetical protein
MVCRQSASCPIPRCFAEIKVRVHNFFQLGNSLIQAGCHQFDRPFRQIPVSECECVGENSESRSPEGLTRGDWMKMVAASLPREERDRSRWIAQSKPVPSGAAGPHSCRARGGGNGLYLKYREREGKDDIGLRKFVFRRRNKSIWPVRPSELENPGRHALPGFRGGQGYRALLEISDIPQRRRRQGEEK